MMEVVELYGDSTMEMIETRDPSPEIPGYMIEAVRARIGGPPPIGGKIIGQPVTPASPPVSYLSINAYSDHGQLALRHDHSYLSLTDNKFDSAAAYDALDQALAFYHKGLTDIGFPPKPGAPDEDVSAEDQRMWVRTRDFEAILVLRIGFTGNYIMFPGIGRFPRYVLKHTLGEMMDCLVLYHRLLEERVYGGTISSSSPTAAYFVNYLNLGFVGTREVSSEMVHYWAAGSVESEALLPMTKRAPSGVYPYIEICKKAGLLEDYHNVQTVPVEEIRTELENMKLAPEVDEPGAGWFKPKNKGWLGKQKTKTAVTVVPTGPRLATLPQELVEEIASHLVLEMTEDRRAPDYNQAAAALSRTCRYFRRVFQPLLFHSVLVENDAHADRLYETLNGSSQRKFVPPSLESEWVTDLVSIPGVIPVMDIEPISKEKAFLRDAVRRLEVSYDPEKQTGYDKGPPDLRLLLQIVPNLRHFVLFDTPAGGILVRSARVLRRCSKLDTFFYSSGSALADGETLTTFRRVVGNLTRLKKLHLEQGFVGMIPWIFPQDLGPEIQEPGTRALLGKLEQHVWFRPMLIVPERPSTHWLPQRLTELELDNMHFRAPSSEKASEAVQRLLEAHSDGLKKTGEAGAAVDWATWPSAFHPLSRLLLCSHNTLKVLRLKRIRGVPHAVVLAAMRVIGPRLEHLSLMRHRDDTGTIIQMCILLKSLEIDTYVHTFAEAQHIIDYCLPAPLRTLKMDPPKWPSLLNDWLRPEAIGPHPGLKTLDITSWSSWLQEDAHFEPVPTMLVRCQQRAIDLVVPPEFAQWKEDASAKEHADRDAPGTAGDEIDERMDESGDAVTA